MAIEAPSPHVRFDLSLDGRLAALMAVIGLQAFWLGALMLGGWYSGADLANLGVATGQSLDSHYLTLSAGGHFGAPARFVYWVLNRIAPLNWPLTVLLRLLLQAGATYLLWRLIEELVGRRTWVSWVMALYAFSPLLVPASFVFSNGLGVMVAQTAILGALLLHVRYTRNGQLWQALSAAVLVLLGLVFADEAIILVAVLPLLSLGFLHQGPLRKRLRASAHRWQGWAVFAAAAGVLLGLYQTGDYLPRTGGFTVADAWDIAHTEWTHVLGPALVGGPWVWSYHSQEWAAYAAPPIFTQVLGQVALIALVVLSVRATGRRALLAWSMPVLTTIGGAVLVGFARHAYLGTFIAPILRYSYFTAATLALGVCLAFARPEQPEPKEFDELEEAFELSSNRTLGPRTPATAAGLVLLLSVVSTFGFAARFWDNPASSYVGQLRQAARAAGPTAELYDTPVPNAVLPRLEPNHFISDLLALADVPVVFGGSSPTPLFATDTGALVPSTFLSVADVTSSTTAPCGTFLSGAGSVTVRLGPLVDAGEWYLQLQLYQPRPNTFTLEVRDPEGKLLELAGGGDTARLTGTLVAIHRRVARGVPATLTLTTHDTATNACLVHAYVGGPFPK
jgi:hypothetical protein